MMTRYVVALALLLGPVGCGDDGDVVGDWFDCGSGAEPSATCSSSGIHYGADYTWTAVDGTVDGADGYCGATRSGRHGTWDTEWLANGVKIFRYDESGRSVGPVDGYIMVKIEGDLMTRECLLCPDEFWRRAAPSRYDGPCAD